MSTNYQAAPTEDRPGLLAGILTRIGTIAAFMVLTAVILFAGAGGIGWIWAWVFLGICLLSVSVNALIMLRSSMLGTNLETIAERGRPQETQAWDKVVSSLSALTMYLCLPLVAALDVRFRWTGELSAAWHVAGTLVLAIGLELTSWAMLANAFFSTAVRIQTERGHTVCRTGPYRFVRHPGYVGFILQSLAIPFLLGSLWALVPGTVTVVLVSIRTYLEDRMLQGELPGYQEYTHEVRYRLIPGTW